MPYSQRCVPVSGKVKGETQLFTYIPLHVLGCRPTMAGGKESQAVTLNRSDHLSVARAASGEYILVRHNQGSCRAVTEDEVERFFDRDRQPIPSVIEGDFAVCER